jgi:hypothetical protein
MQAHWCILSSKNKLRLLHCDREDFEEVWRRYLPKGLKLPLPSP